MLKQLRTYLGSPISIAPLSNFRMLFGGVMLASVLRFMLRGWVTELYVKPSFFFHYPGFEWVKPLGETGLFVVFGLMALSCLGIMLGAFYRISSISFFLLWTYVELLDLTNYLNHYYFVSITAFLLIWVPAAKNFSIDSWLWPEKSATEAPRWTIGIFRLQLGILYFFAGLAKVQADWLLRAMPMRIWLPSRASLPLIGGLLKIKWVAFAFSWAGCIYDLFVPFLLMMRKTRPFAYAAVVAFHLLTWWLFPIGMFPFIMIMSTLIFFPAEFHLKLQNRMKKWIGREGAQPAKVWIPRPFWLKLSSGVLAVHFVVQVLFPLRSHLYDGELFWHEQGFRFSWRVMLMEKAGHITFRVRDPKTGKMAEVNNKDFLQPNQEKMMATQPDMILQFAHFLHDKYASEGIVSPEIYADSYVTLNGSGSRPFVDPSIDLSKIEDGFGPRDWLLPFEMPGQISQAR